MIKYSLKSQWQNYCDSNLTVKNTREERVKNINRNTRRKQMFLDLINVIHDLNTVKNQ